MEKIVLTGGFERKLRYLERASLDFPVIIVTEARLRLANDDPLTTTRNNGLNFHWDWEKRIMQKCYTHFLTVIILLMLTTIALSAPMLSAAQTPTATYQPKFAGDPARSDSEAAALAYMRVVLRAQRQFNKQYGHFATSLAELVHSGSFTKRMVNPNRGEYTASFAGKKDSFVLTMTPAQIDAQHRSFYAEDDGKIHAEEDKPADANSPVVK